MDNRNKMEARFKAFGTEYEIDLIAVHTQNEEPISIDATSLNKWPSRAYVTGLHAPKRITITGYLGDIVKPSRDIPKIKDVIFNPPATIVLWEDGTKTVVKANEPSSKMIFSSRGFELESVNSYDPEKGLAMCIAKKVLGNKSSYYNEFKKWLKEGEDA